MAKRPPPAKFELPQDEMVWRYKVYDAATDDYILSERYATNLQIRLIPGAVSVGPIVTINRKYLTGGWTKKGFDPENPS